MGDTGLSLQLFMAGDDDIIVNPAWKPCPGDPMPQMPGVRIGKQFGAGALAFNTIYDLVDEKGKSIGQALKACRPTLAARRSLAHEWKMFKDLSLLANDFQAARSHFLQAHRVVRLGDGRISGIVMEKANGKNVNKTLRDPDFCNVRYVITLLRDLLVGLDVAQRVLGFTHYDLKLDNVIEHWHGDPKAGQARVMIDAVPQFKIFDFGTAVVYPDPFSMRTAVDTELHEQRPDAAPQLAEQKPHNRRGKINDRDAAERYASGYEYSTPFCCVRLYHMWWKQRGDVYRVLLALCRDLDNHTWPVEDLELVSLLFTVLEHTTNSKRLRAKFEPRSVLLHKLYGPNPPPAPLDSAHSSGLTRAQTAALLQQHSQIVLQGSTSMRLASQGSTLLPSAGSIEAYGRQQQQKQQPQQQRHQKHGVQHLQGVAEVGPEGGEDAEGGVDQGPVPVGTPSRTHTLRINTTKIPAAPTPAGAAAGTAASPAAAAGAAAPQAPAAAAGGDKGVQLLPPPSPTYTGTGGQYTSRRSTEVPREDPSSSTVPGMRYVRLAKAQDAAAVAPTAAAAAATNAGGGFSTGGGTAAAAATDGSGWTTTFTRYPAAADTAGPAAAAAGPAAGKWTAENGSTSSSTPPASPFAGSRAQGPAVASAGIPGVQPMVTAESAEQRRMRQQKAIALSQQQQQLAANSNHTSNMNGNTNSSSSGGDGKQTASAVAAATAAAAAAAPAPAGDKIILPSGHEYELESAPTGVPDPFTPAPGGLSSNTPADRRAENHPSHHPDPMADPNTPNRHDSAGTLVAKQPMAAAEQQSVLGSRKALRGVTAQQLLVEPLVQSLLSKV